MCLPICGLFLLPVNKPFQALVKVTKLSGEKRIAFIYNPSDFSCSKGPQSSSVPSPTPLKLRSFADIQTKAVLQVRNPAKMKVTFLHFFLFSGHVFSSLYCAISTRMLK